LSTIIELDPSKLAKVTDPKRQGPRYCLGLGTSSPDRVFDPLRQPASPNEQADHGNFEDVHVHERFEAHLG
jgi:hypothetical protein